MHSNHESHVPIHTTPEEENRYMHHHSAHYYVHRVKENLTTRVSKFICAMFLFVLFVVSLVAFILWLSLRPHRPRFYVAEFQLSPSLDQPDGFQNAKITYNVTIRNSNRKIVVHYDSIYGKVHYRDLSLGEALIWSDPFDQEPKNTTSIVGLMTGSTLTVSSQRWTDFMNDMSSAQGRVVFRLEITSVMRFEIYSWGTKKNKMHANCDVAVGTNGTILDGYKNKRCYVSFS